MARGQEKPAQGLSKSAAETHLHASERKPYDSGASEILANRYLVKRY